MVLLASGVVSKQNGKILLSRQFVEMTRSRIEGLLTAFTKLITKDKQHTFIETDTVRYVYQALMDKLYCVLITTKTSNILEDLETLRLFVRVINEYTSSQTKGSSDEQAINDNAFTLIFAFDEIVALGYRESVNMSQVRTFIEMDSHEERVFVAVRQTQERDAKQKMREKAKELSKMQKTQQNERVKSIGGSSINALSSGINEIKLEQNVGDRAIGSSSVPSMIRPKGTSKALKLGSRSGQSLFSPAAEEQLVTELKQEATAPNAVISEEPVTVIVEERLKCELSRDGGLVRSCELSGVMQILIQQEQYARVKFGVECEDTENVQIQTHPNVDKELFKQQNLITLRQKSFPINSSVGVLKYRRMNTSGKDWPPLVINAWPNGNNCNLELQVNRPLNEVVISIPCSSQPIVNECSEGDYEWKRGILSWHISVITVESPSATIDFDLNTTLNNEEFFPISCTFKSDANLAGIKITEVIDDESDEEVKWAVESRLVVEKYDIS